MFSLRTRLLASITMVMTLFLGLTGLLLDKSFQDYARSAIKDRLQGHVYALIAAADIDNEYKVIRLFNIPETRFVTPGSGLYAQITTNDLKQTWASPSTQGQKIPFAQQLDTLEERFGLLSLDNGTPLFAYSLGVTWDDSKLGREGVTFSVAETLDNYHIQLRNYRRNLWSWLAGVAVLLLFIQGVIVRWGFTPLRQLTYDLEAIESGEKALLQDNYPKDLRRLTNNLNTLIRKERKHIERYRNTLADLAHSLKTPLAVLRGGIDGKENDADKLQGLICEQVDRMSQIVEYQLQRAATAGGTSLTAPISIKTIAQKVVATLNKVYADKHVESTLKVSGENLFHGDEGDLMEVFGNLLDNAYKWCKSKVIVTIDTRAKNSKGSVTLTLAVEDDGPGIPDAMAASVLKRGIRADESIAGHGIGLAVVQDITHVYDGELTVGRSKLGGACMTVTLKSY